MEFRRINALPPYVFATIDTLKMDARHAGEDVIDLNCAAHSAPPGLVEAYQRATEQLPAYLSGPGYFPLGVPVLQTRIAAAYEARGLPTVPEQVMVTAGALAAASVVAQAFTAPGERVVVSGLQRVRPGIAVTAVSVEELAATGPKSESGKSAAARTGSGG